MVEALVPKARLLCLHYGLASNGLVKPCNATEGLMREKPGKALYSLIATYKAPRPHKFLIEIAVS